MNLPLTSRKSTRLLVAGLAIAGLLAGSMSSAVLKSLIGSGDRRARIELVPTSLTAPSVVREYDVVQFDFQVKNSTSEGVLWKTVEGSCGCMSFSQPNGKPLAFPVKLAPDESTPFRLTVKTGGVIGEQRYSFVAAGDSETADCMANGEVSLNVAAGIRVTPAFLRFDADDSSFDRPARMIVYDNSPDNGVKIQSITSTRPELLVVQMDEVPDGGHEPIPSLSGLKPRQIVTVALSQEGASVPEQVFASIAIQPVSSTHPVVDIPVMIRPAKLAVRFSPGTVVVSNASTRSSATGIVRKTVYCYTTGQEDLRIRREVPGVKPSLRWTAKENCWQLDLEINVDKLSQEQPLEITLTYSEEPELDFRLPIRVIGDR
ncbi:MAG: hypothetical protein WD851_00260 [Pirellulales bacterium]